MQNTFLSPEEFLNLVLSKKNSPDDRYLLPHEKQAVEAAYDDQASAYQKIVDAKVSVSGGDDWHDGAFRATDNEAKIISARSAAIAPFLGAVAVAYPDESETRVTLGSRTTINQNGYSFPVDLVGFRNAYPREVIEQESSEEVTAVSPESPLGGAILGKEVGQEAEYVNNGRRMKVVIERINQTAVREFFKNDGKNKIEINET